MGEMGTKPISPIFYSLEFEVGSGSGLILWGTKNPDDLKAFGIFIIDYGIVIVLLR